MSRPTQMSPEVEGRIAELATRTDVSRLYADLSATLAASRDSMSACMDRAVRRTALMLGALLVLAGAAVVLLAWSVS